MCARWGAEVSLGIGTSLEQSKCCVPLLAAEKFGNNDKKKCIIHAYSPSGLHLSVRAAIMHVCVCEKECWHLQQS